MNKELDAKLCAKYPKIFRDRNALMSQTCMVWGFSHDDGWYNIIDQLCSNIQWHIDRSREQRLIALLYNRALSKAITGDFSTYSRLNAWMKKSIDDELSDPEPQLKTVPAICEQVVAIQVKEKFGTLRFYYYGGDDIVQAYVNMAESMSSVTCETCGSPGITRSGGWIQALCDIHGEGREEWKLEY